MNELETYPSILNLVTDIVSAYLSNNHVVPEFIPTLIKQTYQALSQPYEEELSGHTHQERPEPAVNVKHSVFEDYIVCLEDGKHLKMLKRHLKSDHDLTPEEYRKRWKLPADYPMVAPNYAKKRSRLARVIRLGHTKK